MARRKLDGTPVEDQEGTPVSGGIGGMWGGTALNMLKQRLEDTRAGVAQGVMAGTVVLELDPGQIEDAAGSDRTTGWQEDEDFAALVENIRRRGQTQPIRVRPKDPAWRPDPDRPTEAKGVFLIQSGRRRLEACRRLGRPVKAVLSTIDGDAALADLEERFHENTMRRNLTGFEELLSIGLIARALGDLNQEEIAQRLAVPQGEVSLGRDCVELHDEIVASVDVATTPKRAFRSIVPKLKRGGEPTVPAKAAKVARAEVDGVRVEVRRRGRGGATVTVDSDRPIDIDHLARRLAQMVSKPHKPV